MSVGQNQDCQASCCVRMVEWRLKEALPLPWDGKPLRLPLCPSGVAQQELQDTQEVCQVLSKYSNSNWMSFWNFSFHFLKRQIVTSWYHREVVNCSPEAPWQEIFADGVSFAKLLEKLWHEKGYIHSACLFFAKINMQTLKGASLLRHRRAERISL